MKASEMKQGDMFIYLPTYTNEAEVFVKETDKEVQGKQVSLFVKNSALAKFATFKTPVTPFDKWGISDDYFANLQKQGQAIRILGLNEAEEICKELGYTLPDIFEGEEWD